MNSFSPHDLGPIQSERLRHHKEMGTIYFYFIGVCVDTYVIYQVDHTNR